ncbi:pyridoxal phosphate-dependent aminotransferase [Rhodovarius crocodyli]|nr:pyridoxal phosphate-dependent aminotransferase [Rhodovarius crocodyli]
MNAIPRFNLAESTVRSLRLEELLLFAETGSGLLDLPLDYGDRAGLPALREVLAAQSGVAPDAVVTLPGTMLGLHLLARRLCRAGGEALLVTPCYGPSRTVLDQAGVVVRTARLLFEEGYRPDIARIAAMLRHETRLVVLADPNNPSGVRMPREAVQALLGAMARRAPRAVLFIDETYREATYGPEPAPSAACLGPRVVTAGSLSKAHGAPGLRIGWLTVPDAPLREELAAAKEALILSGSVLDETLAAALLARPEGLLAERRHALAHALDMVTCWQADHAPLLEMVRPEAGALCCLRLNPARVGPQAVMRFWAALPQKELRLAPGPWFGEAPGVFRLGFGHLPPAALAAALRALSRVLEETL